MNVDEFLFGGERLALIDAILCTAVADIVFGTGNDTALAEKVLIIRTALQSVDNPFGIFADNFRAF